jgi:hypothetical protein
MDKDKVSRWRQRISQLRQIRGVDYNVILTEI